MSKLQNNCMDSHTVTILCFCTYMFTWIFYGTGAVTVNRTPCIIFKYVPFNSTDGVFIDDRSSKDDNDDFNDTWCNKTEEYIPVDPPTDSNITNRLCVSVPSIMGDNTSRNATVAENVHLVTSNKTNNIADSISMVKTPYTDDISKISRLADVGRPTTDSEFMSDRNSTKEKPNASSYIMTDIIDTWCNKTKNYIPVDTSTDKNNTARLCVSVPTIMSDNISLSETSGDNVHLVTSNKTNHNADSIYMGKTTDTDDISKIGRLADVGRPTTDSEFIGDRNSTKEKPSSYIITDFVTWCNKTRNSNHVDTSKDKNNTDRLCVRMPTNTSDNISLSTTSPDRLHLVTSNDAKQKTDSIPMNKITDTDDISINGRLRLLQDLTMLQNEGIKYLHKYNVKLRKQLAAAYGKIKQLEKISRLKNCDGKRSNSQEFGDVILGSNKKCKLKMAGAAVKKRRKRPIVVKLITYRNIKLILDGKNKARVVGNKVKRKMRLEQ